MGLKAYIAVFLIFLIVANIVVFFFVRGINLVDRFRSGVLILFEKYLPIDDPLLSFLLLSFVAITVVAFVMLTKFRNT